MKFKRCAKVYDIRIQSVSYVKEDGYFQLTDMKISNEFFVIVNGFQYL